MLKIDQREDKKVFEVFEKAGAPVEKCTLSLGDIFMENLDLCIEHKQIGTGDFLRSYWDGHIQKQLLDIQNNHKNNYLIITGDVQKYAESEHCPKNFTPQMYASMIASLTAKYPGIKLIQFQTLEMLPLFVKSLIQRISAVNNGEKVTVTNTELMRNTLTTTDYRIKLLTCFQGLGYVRAKKLLEKDAKLVEQLDAIISKFI